MFEVDQLSVELLLSKSSAGNSRGSELYGWIA